MQEFIEAMIEFLKNLVYSNNPIIGIFLGMTIIVLESIIPILPLAVFIAVNMLVFGPIVGFIISWIATSIGCLLSFTIFRYAFSGYFNRKIANKEKIKKLMDRFTNIKFTTLVLVMAMPFTPAFSINIAGGLSKINYRKFMAAVIISKLAVIYFWGFIGTTLLESITDISVLIRISLILIGAYIISKLINKKFKIE